MTEASSTSKPAGISVVITNYNGRALLERCLPSVDAAIRAYPGPSEVLLVDDCSSDDSREYVYTNFPSVTVLKPKHNLGFQRASNFGFEKARHPIVISLNNDIEVTPASFGQLAAHFSDPDLFSVSTKVFMWDHATYLAGRRRGIFESGHFRLVDEEGNGRVTPTLFSTGGACAFDRAKLSALGGFDSIFHPLYWEDIDLCYRAWKRGWTNRYDPNIVLYHKHRATIETMVEPDKLKQVTARNSYLFLWKNLTDAGAWASHLFHAPWWIVKDIVRGRLRFPIGFGMALLRIPQVIASRSRERGHLRKTDAAVFAEHSAA